MNTVDSGLPFDAGLNDHSFQDNGLPVEEDAAVAHGNVKVTQRVAPRRWIWTSRKEEVSLKGSAINTNGLVSSIEA